METAVLEVENLDKIYILPNGESLHAVNEVNFALRKGEFLGLVGESGCGKSTIAKLLVGLVRKTGGSIKLYGNDIENRFYKDYFRQVQMIFQMPKESFDPRQTIRECLVRVQMNFGMNKISANENVARLLKMVRLPENYVDKYPVRMSGGECQRAAIARALSIKPNILICDEITSALDVSVQAQVVELLRNLQKENNMSVLFITHDLALAGGLCDRIMVMDRGRIVEEGEASKILTNPKDKYTKLLINSVLM